MNTFSFLMTISLKIRFQMSYNKGGMPKWYAFPVL